MKKLIYFYHSLSGGISITIFQRLTILKNFFNVSYVVPYFDEKSRSYNVYSKLMNESIDLIRLVNNPKLFKNDLFLQKRIKTYLNKTKPDIIILPSTNQYVRLFGKIAKEIGKSKICIEIRDYLSVTGSIDELIYLNDIPHVIYPNSLSGTEMLKYLLPSMRIKTIINGINVEALENERFLKKRNPFEKFIDEKDIVLTMVSHIHYKKNHILFVNIISELIKTHKNIKAFIIGHDATMGKYIKELVMAKRLDKYIIFLGLIEDVDAAYKHTDIYCQTSLWEGMPKSLLEAMARALPVVTVKSPGIEEIIKNEVDGFIVNNDDCLAFVNYLRNLIDDSESRQKIGEKAKNKIFKKYNLFDICTKYAEELLSLSNVNYKNISNRFFKQVKQKKLMSSHNSIIEELEKNNWNSLFPVIVFKRYMDFSINNDCFFFKLQKKIAELFENKVFIGYLWQMKDIKCLKTALIAGFWLYERSHEKYVKKKSEEFLVILNTIFKCVYPKKLAVFYYNTGSFFERKGDYSVAKSIFLKTKKIIINSVYLETGVLFHLGRIALKEGNMTLAYKLFLETLEKNPNHFEAKQNLDKFWNNT